MRIESPHRHWKNCSTCGLGDARRRAAIRLRAGVVVVLALAVVVAVTRSIPEAICLAGAVAILRGTTSCRTTR